MIEYSIVIICINKHKFNLRSNLMYQEHNYKWDPPVQCNGAMWRKSMPHPITYPPLRVWANKT